MISGTQLVRFGKYGSTVGQPTPNRIRFGFRDGTAIACPTLCEGRIAFYKTPSA
ncbi:hypothetical protein AB3R30_12170 [Leptolyngbyaceae cyanobacterium UHCC 1019]